MIVLRPTDLPLPVVPATSRCGIAARSAITGSPAMSLPRMIGRSPGASTKSAQAASSLKPTIWRSALGSSMPITVLPGTVLTRAETALMLRAMSSDRPITRAALVPGAGSSSYMVTTGPVRTAVTSPFTLKSSSTDSSSRALRSSACRSSGTTLASPRSDSSSRLGRSNAANMSFCRVIAWPSALRGATLGSTILGARRAAAGSAAGSSITGSSTGARFAVRRSGLGLAGAGSARSRCIRRGRLGRVSSPRQSIAKTRATSVVPTASNTSATARISQPAAGPTSRVAIPSVRVAPSSPVSPPAPAGSAIAASAKVSAATVDSSVIASSSAAAGRHQRVCRSTVSSSLAARHSPRAPI